MRFPILYKKRKVKFMKLNSVSPLRNYTPNFGMAVKIDKNAHAVIKRQLAGLSNDAVDSFWKELDAVTTRQAENPVNILLRKCNNRKALAAEVVDNSNEPLDNRVFTQGLFRPKGLKFMSKAETYADNVNSLNTKLAKYDEALDVDYDPSLAEKKNTVIQIECNK